jgi:hypothetical protein
MVAVAGTGWRLAPSLVAYVEEADRYYPQRDRASDGSIGDLRHQAAISDHNPDGGMVHAVDLDEDLAPGLDLRRFSEHLRLGRDARIKYVIYEGRMFASYRTRARAAWAWGPYSGANAHEHHLHLSILDTIAAEQDTSPWGFAHADGTPEPEPPDEEDPDDMAAFELWRDSRDNRLYRVDKGGTRKVWIRTVNAKRIDYLRQGSQDEFRASEQALWDWLDSVPVAA